MTMLFCLFSVTAVTSFPLTEVPVRASKSPSIWESTVTIVGIAICGLVVTTAITFVIYHRACHKRDHKYKMAAHEESPMRMVKSTSMRSTPSHDSHHGIEIEHDMEIPLTRVPDPDRKKARHHGSTKSRGSHTSTNNVKKFRTKADIERGSSARASPLTPKGDYTQVPQVASSPRRVVCKNHDMSPNDTMTLFRTSPLVKPKVPRSPKIHPSPKVRHFHNVRTPLSHECTSPNTKQSSLSHLSCSASSEPHRMVLGSDYTPTNSVKSPPSDISKTGSDTPTNINNDVILRKQKSKQEPIKTNDCVDDDKTANELKDFGKQNGDDNERKPPSGTSDESGSAEKDGGSQMTTSFIENNSKPRRPTSLTESYSKMSISSAISKSSVENGGKDKNSVTSSDDRQQVLPKPDGQSPKSQRVENVKSESRNGSPLKTSKASTPRSVRSVRSEGTNASNNSKSPARSINTPSDVENLEYDDFIDMDDTYSYFDPVETEKLTWHGSERVTTKTSKEEKKSNI